MDQNVGILIKNPCIAYGFTVYKLILTFNHVSYFILRLFSFFKKNPSVCFCLGWSILAMLTVSLTCLQHGSLATVWSRTATTHFQNTANDVDFYGKDYYLYIVIVNVMRHKAQLNQSVLFFLCRRILICWMQDCTFITHHTFGPDKSVVWALSDPTEVVAAQLGSENCRNLGVFSLLSHLFTGEFINLPDKNIIKKIKEINLSF